MTCIANNDLQQHMEISTDIDRLNFYIEEIQEAELDIPKIMDKVCRVDERINTVVKEMEKIRNWLNKILINGRVYGNN